MSLIASMYEVAIRKKLRFDSPKGLLTLEQVWDVPLTSRDDFNLDTVAKTVNKKLKDVSEESFVTKNKTVEQTELELKLDLIKHVIDVKQDEVERAETRAENKKKREKLMELLEKKQDSKLDSMSEAQIKKQLAELSDD